MSCDLLIKELHKWGDNWQPKRNNSVLLESGNPRGLSNYDTNIPMIMKQYGKTDVKQSYFPQATIEQTKSQSSLLPDVSEDT